MAEAEIIELSEAEYTEAKDRALASLGLTYDELAEQARNRAFTSSRARALWVAIGS